MLPVVSRDVYNSAIASLKSEGNEYLGRGLEIIKTENPEIYMDLVIAARKFDDSPITNAILEASIRGTILTYMVLRSQIEADEMNKVWG